MSQQGSALEVRPATRSEIELAVDWAAREGWNPGLADAVAFAAADPEGFLVGRVDGEPVCVISAVRYPEKFGFVGFYIVDPAWRGRGFGIAIWNEAMRRLDGHVVGLDGVVDQQENYARSGFVLAHRNVRFGGVIDPEVIATGDDTAIRELNPANLTMVTEYDRRHFPAPREAFLRAWIGQPDALTVGVDAGKGLTGFGTIRPSRSGAKIGPLFADDVDTATRIVHRLAAHPASGTEVFLDVPEPNEEAMELARDLGLQPVFETARMYRGGDPRLPLERIFGITSFELG